MLGALAILFVLIISNSLSEITKEKAADSHRITIVVFAAMAIFLCYRKFGPKPAGWFIAYVLLFWAGMALDHDGFSALFVFGGLVAGILGIVTVARTIYRRRNAEARKKAQEAEERERLEPEEAEEAESALRRMGVGPVCQRGTTPVLGISAPGTNE